MKAIVGLAIFLCLWLTSCNSEPSLQKYFVENTENKNFIALDISSSILNLDQAKLSLEQKEALQSFEKMNVLAFKRNPKNNAEFETERAKLNGILKNPKYQQLMKFGSGKEGASVSFVGTDEHIEEFILFANQKETGFAVVRVLGKDMNPTHIMNMMSVLQQSKIDLDQLKPLQALMKK
jgi:phage repressor protein C with HTH and peptisase S24 domain